MKKRQAMWIAGLFFAFGALYFFFFTSIGLRLKMYACAFAYGFISDGPIGNAFRFCSGSF